LSFGHAPLTVPWLPHKQIELKLQTAVRAICRRPTPPSFWSARVPIPNSAIPEQRAHVARQARKMNPRQLATDVVAKLDVGDWCERWKLPARLPEFPAQACRTRPNA